ncbi:MAG TPA: hypothetical protein ENN07_00170 [candidate division Zixibacteria bacterium]|nr:hypothetical protein [candidate division Zixibacteria bacterium]
MNNRPKIWVYVALLFLCVAIPAVAENWQAYSGISLVGQAKELYPQWNRNIPLLDVNSRLSYKAFNLDIGARIIVYEFTDENFATPPTQSTIDTLALMPSIRLSYNVYSEKSDCGFANNNVSIGVESYFGKLVEKSETRGTTTDRFKYNWFGIGPYCAVNVYIPQTTLHASANFGMMLVNYQDETFVTPVLSAAISTFFVIWDDGFVAPKFW